MCTLLHNNQVGISGNIISFLTCFVRIPARNSMNCIIKTTWLPSLLALFAETCLSQHMYLEFFSSFGAHVLRIRAPDKRGV